VSGIVAGLLALAALPPVGFAPAGLVWLVPWLMGLRQPRHRRLIPALIAPGLPLGVAMAPLAGRHPALVAVVTLAVWAPFALTAWLAADRNGRTSAARMAAALLGLILMLAILRALGLPISLSLFMPARGVPFAMTGALGVLGADALIGLGQAALAAALMRPVHCSSHRARRWPESCASAVIALIALAPALIPADPAPPAPPDAPRLAVVQTVMASAQHSSALARIGLDAVEARWVAWPEADSPVLLRPPWQRAPGQRVQLRHGYRYERPGVLESAVPIRPGHTAGSAAAQGWSKAFPLPFAEAGIAPAQRVTPGGIDNIEVLICSDATHPRAVAVAAGRHPRLIVNPARVPGPATGLLSGLHRRAVHLQAAHKGIPIAVIAHGGPSALLHPNGHQRGLAPAGVPAVVAVALPARLTGRRDHRGRLAGGLAVGWLALGLTGPRRYPPLRRRPATAIALSMALVTGGLITTAHDPALRPDQRVSERPLGRALERDHHPHPAIARLARAYGITASVQAVPTGRAAALEWLCEQTGLMAMPAGAGTPRPPAFGLTTTRDGLRAVRWRPGARPQAVSDGTAGGPYPVAADAPGMHWLVTVRRPQRCRSAGHAIAPTGGTSRDG